MNRFTKMLLATAAGLCVSSAASAASFVTLQVLGNTDNSSNYSSSVTVTPGQTVYYEVVGVLAGSGSNAQGPFSLSSQTAGTDGINSLEFDLNGIGTGGLGQATLASSWKLGPGGPTEGTISGASLIDTYAAQNAGTFVGVGTPSVILTGTFTAGTSASQSLAASWNTNPGGFGGIKVNATSGQTAIQLTPDTESSSDPYVSYSGLSLSTNVASPVPSPAAIPGVVLILALDALVRKFRGRIA